MPIKLTKTNNEAVTSKIYTGSTYFTNTACPDTFQKEIINTLRSVGIVEISAPESASHTFLAKSKPAYSPSQYPSTMDMTNFQGVIAVNIYKTQGTSYPLALHIQIQAGGNLYRSKIVLDNALEAFTENGFNLKAFAEVADKPFPNNQITSKL